MPLYDFHPLGEGSVNPIPPKAFSQRPYPYQPRATLWGSDANRLQQSEGLLHIQPFPIQQAMGQSFRLHGFMLSHSPGRRPGLVWVRPLADFSESTAGSRFNIPVRRRYLESGYVILSVRSRMVAH